MSAAALSVKGVSAGYGRTTVLRDIELEVPAGAVVALLGPNGAGKTTLLRVASGTLRPTAGQVLIDGWDVTGLPSHERTRRGLFMVPEGRGVFPNLTVRENLWLQVPPWRRRQDVSPALDAFPVLGRRLTQRAGTLSGGEQQMLAVARCFLGEPSVVLLDEVSMGLAPQVIDQIIDALKRLAAAKIALLLVEQYVARALELADHVHILERGRLTFSGSPSQLDGAEVMRRYLGMPAQAGADHDPVAGGHQQTKGGVDR